MLSIRKKSGKDDEDEVEPGKKADEAYWPQPDDLDEDHRPKLDDEDGDDGARPNEMEERQRLIECAPGFEKIIPPRRHSRRGKPGGKTEPTRSCSIRSLSTC